jgi:hypothetical protein
MFTLTNRGMNKVVMKVGLEFNRKYCLNSMSLLMGTAAAADDAEEEKLETDCVRDAGASSCVGKHKLDKLRKAWN